MDTSLKQLGLITAVGALLRLPTLTVESFWYDETFTAWLASLPPRQLLAATLADVHPPTWYLLEWVMATAFGPTEFSLRLISALAGIALIPAVYWLAVELDLDQPQPLAAALLTAIAPFAVYYSQEARAYSLIYLLTTVATAALISRRWGLLVCSAIFAMYLHNLAVFYVAALGWLALWLHRDKWQMWASFAVIGLAWLPWLVVGLLPQLGDVSDGFWVRMPTWGTLFFTLTAFVFSGHALLLALVTVPLLTAAAMAAKPMARTVQWQLWGLVLIPMGLAVIASMLAAPILVERVIGSSAMPLYLLLAPALTLPFWQKPASPWGWALPQLFVALVVTFFGLYWFTDRIGRYPWDYGLEPMLAQLQPDDGLFHANLATYIILDHYLPDNEQVVWRQANDLSQSLTDDAKWAMAMHQAQFEAVACDHPRWWLAFYENPTTSDRERAEIARIVATYGGQETTTILKNILVDARVYRIDNPCGVAAR